MARPESWMQRSELILTGVAVLVALVAYVVSRIVGF
jgi:hypothetical protein